MNVPITQLGSIGLITDLPEFELPPQAWTDARNVRFLGPSVVKAFGRKVLASYVTLDPMHVSDIFSVVSGTEHYWVLCSADYIHTFISNRNIGDITGPSGPYTGTVYDKWNGGMFNGLLILNNGVDVPQMWDLPGGATVLADLTAWPSTARANVVRPFKEFLVALGITKSGVFDKRLVKWSHAAAPLAAPTSWDETDPTLDAGEYPLSDGQDALVDCLPLGDVNIIYTEQQTWSMRLSGTSQIFAFRQLFPSSGMLSQNCAVQFSLDNRGPDSHFVITHDDIRVHDGSSMQSVATDKIRRRFFDTLTETSYRIVRVAKLDGSNEIWTLFADGGGSVNDTALVWNYRYGTWTIRDIPSTRAVGMAYQAPKIGASTWADRNSTWNALTSVWGDSNFVKVIDRMVVFDENTAQLVDISEDYTSDNGTAIAATFERISMPIKGFANGNAVYDDNSKAILRGVWPQITGDAGVTLQVSVGWQDTREDAITWLAAKPFVLGSNRPVDFVMQYRYLSIRFTETSGLRWKMQGYSLEISPLGKF